MIKNRILLFLLAMLIAALSESCGTTRKTAQISTEQHITSSQHEDRHSENQNKEAVNLSQNINEITNAVIEFTKVEFNDGTSETDTTQTSGDTPMPKPKNRESKKPPNSHSGIKSITTGRIDFNNNRTQKTDADITTEDKSQSDESIDAKRDENNATDTESEEKPIRGFIYYVSTITGAIAAFITLCFIIRRLRRRLSHKD